jgi:fumarate hydratase class II
VRVIARLATETGQALRPARNPFAAQGAHDAIVHASGALRGVAVALAKIAGDLRLLASGPRCGLGELRLPANEPGSSIMPGKVNPTQAEALIMICNHVMGLDVAVALGGAAGQLELNACKPLLIHDLLQMAGLLADGARSFAGRCVEGLEPDRERIADHLSRSLMLVTALVPRIGYDRAAAAVRKAHDEGLPLREAVLELQLLTADEFDAAVRDLMTGERESS